MAQQACVPRVSGPETTLLTVKSQVGREEIEVGGVDHISEKFGHE